MIRSFLFLLLLFPLIVGAQPASLVDSLIQEFESGEKDEASLSLLRTICVEHPSSKGRLIYARELLLLSEALEAKDFIHYAYMELGISYRLQGNLTESARNLFRALDLAKELDDVKKEGEAYGEIATTFASQGDTKNAVRYVNQAIQIFRIAGDSTNLCIALLNTGYDYHTMGKTDSALLYYAEAESITRVKGFDPELKVSLAAYIRGNRGITQAEIGLLDDAIESIDSAITILRSLGDRQAIVDYDYQLARIYYQKEEIDKAMKIAKKALLEATILNIKATMRDASLLLYRMYLSQQDYKSALKYRLTHEAIKDTIQNATVIRDMANQQTAYEVGLMQAQLDLSDAQKKNQVILITALVFIVLIMLIAGMLFYRNYQQKIELSVQLEKKRDQLESINTTKDKLFSIISHDLRGPVTAFSGLARIVRFYVITKKNDELLQLADQMDDSAKKLNNMLENLLAWTIQEQGALELNPEKIPLVKMVGDIQSMYKTLLDEKNITLENASQDDVNVWGDWNTLHTVLRNLVSNAIKFTNEGGRISIEYKASEGNCQIKVTDTGIGINEEKQESLFQLDTSTKNTFGTNGEKGLGLGLKIVYEFVEMNNGQIEVQSKLDKGTSFILTLPMAKEDTVATEKAH